MQWTINGISIYCLNIIGTLDILTTKLSFWKSFKCTDKEKELRLNVHTYVILICIIYNNNERTKHVILSVHGDIFKKAVIENP